MGIRDWGLGTGDWGLGIRDWGLGNTVRISILHLSRDLGKG
ncbi:MULTISPECIES: hypothetical protein [unclassified Tolypothrix]|nr:MULTISPECIES: hypothetical protein [unclassified Tolypothrix]